MADGAVIAAVSPGLRQAVWQFEVGSNFIACQAFVGHTQGLVVDITIQVTLAFQQANNVFVTPGRPVVLSHNNFSFVTPTHYGFVDVFRPRQWFSNFRAAQRVGIVQGVSHILCGFDEFLLFDEPQHVRRCFGTRRQHKIVSQTVNHFFLAVFIDDVSWCNQRHSTC
ncbi:hypothetical protein D3C78_1219180 [compost metagenome]